MNQNQKRSTLRQISVDGVICWHHGWTQKPRCAVGDGSSIYHEAMAIVELADGTVDLIDPHRVVFLPDPITTTETVTQPAPADVDVTHDLQAETSEGEWRLICSSESLSYVREKEKQYRDSDHTKVCSNYRVVKTTTISEVLPRLTTTTHP